MERYLHSPPVLFSSPTGLLSPAPLGAALVALQDSGEIAPSICARIFSKTCLRLSTLNLFSINTWAWVRAGHTDFISVATLTGLDEWTGESESDERKSENGFDNDHCFEVRAQKKGRHCWEEVERRLFLYPRSLVYHDGNVARSHSSRKITDVC